MGNLLYGECVSSGITIPVRICTLEDAGCDLEADACESMLDADVSLWIGAIGPLAARVTHETERRIAVTFNEHLDRRILMHFSA